MMTVKQIQRLWNAQSYRRLLEMLCIARPEAAFAAGEITSPSIAAAAMAIVRLDELSQPHAPLVSQLVKTLLAAQEADGGWGDAMTTALCVRALALGRGEGVALERGVAYLATLQQAGGIWPKVPIRRMPEDPFVSAFVLLQLSDYALFRAAVRVDDAVTWFDANADRLDDAARSLWQSARHRYRTRTTQARSLELMMAVA